MTRSSVGTSALISWLLSSAFLACAGSPAKPTPEQEERRAQAIREYFANRHLDPVEGLWVLEDCELAVVKRIGADDEKEYLGIVTSPDCSMRGAFTTSVNCPRSCRAGPSLSRFRLEPTMAFQDSARKRTSSSLAACTHGSDLLACKSFSDKMSATWLKPQPQEVSHACARRLSRHDLLFAFECLGANVVGSILRSNS